MKNKNKNKKIKIKRKKNKITGFTTNILYYYRAFVVSYYANSY